MTTFKIISITSGKCCGTIKAGSRDEAFNTCLNKGINVYDTYWLMTQKEANSIIFGDRIIA
jgi:hypothetical protein